MSSAKDPATKACFGKEKAAPKGEFYKLIDRDMNGNEVQMSTFEGKVLIAVNVASYWGLTKQNYTELVKICNDYGSRGLEVLAFPCNQFAREEPGTHEEILLFADKFNARDNLIFFEKADVNGASAREVFSFLKTKLPNDDGSNDNSISWNFAKFLIDHNGNPYKRYDPETSPFEMKNDIEILMNAKEGRRKRKKWFTQVKIRNILVCI